MANLVVAKDGSGNFDKIVDAVKAAPNNSNTRFVIHIKAGTYRENVLVGIEKTNIKFLGDGIGKTVLTADRNAKHGFQIDTSATLGVDGFGFLAQDLTVENTSGPENGQAVALRSGSDHSAFYRCSFRGYQDTLYMQRNKQFYRECDVFGTIDFIFGDAAVVLQKCNLFARKPLDNQAVVFTDQGRDNLQSKTGISIHECKFLADAELVPVLPKFKVYLGRPWKKFSRVVILRSFIDTLIDPAGWLETNSNFDNTVFYREYMNNGPGSNTANRVKWPGYKVITDAAEANQFIAATFIDGNQWLGATSIPFTPGLV